MLVLRNECGALSMPIDLMKILPILPDLPLAMSRSKGTKGAYDYMGMVGLPLGHWEARKLYTIMNFKIDLSGDYVFIT